jgi:hypothetical protein
VLSGTTSGARSFIFHDLDTALIHIDFIALSITQRLATQSGFAGIFDNAAAPVQQAAFIFDGTVNTQVRCRSSYSAAATDTQETVVTLPFGLTTNLTTINYSIDITTNKIIFMIAGVVVATHSYHTPEQWTLMDAALGIVNTAAAASTTTISADVALARTYDQVDPGPGASDDEIHSVTGQLTTTTTAADQVIVSVVVPTGKVLYLVGFVFSTPEPSVDAQPAKIGRLPLTGAPAAPGTVDANQLYVFFFNTSVTNLPGFVFMNYGDRPRKLGFAGQTVAITVTPSGAGSVQWNATLEYILRDAVLR